MKRIIIGLVLVILSTNSSADEISDMAFVKVKDFVKEYPLITKDVTILGLVDMWQRIEGLSRMVWLYRENVNYYRIPGDDNPRIFEINKRIWSHTKHSNINTHDDRELEHLKNLIRLHASFSQREMDGEIKLGVYSEVARYVKSYGRYLAERIEKRYGKGQKILKPIPALNWN